MLILTWPVSADLNRPGVGLILTWLIVLILAWSGSADLAWLVRTDNDLGSADFYQAL